VQGDQCLDAPCYHGKVEAFLDREIAAKPELVQIENSWRNPKEQRPGAAQRGHFREIEAVVDNPDAEPVMPCDAAKTAIIVYGKRVGTKLTVCTDKNCPVHDPKAAAEQAAHPAPVMAPAPPTETEEEREQREAEYAQRRKEHEEEQQRREEERKQQFEREQEQYEAERTRREAAHKARQATFERIVENAPAMFTAVQLRVFLHALINLDPYDFAEDVAASIVGDDENNQQTPEEVLASTLINLPDEKLTSFALRLALTGHTGIPRESDLDFLAEAESVFVPPPPKKGAARKAGKTNSIAAKPEAVPNKKTKSAAAGKKKIAA
jgi:ParB family chromosome partitioning protein